MISYRVLATANRFCIGIAALGGPLHRPVPFQCLCLSISENISLLGTDDCNTCVIVVIRHTGKHGVEHRLV